MKTNSPRQKQADMAAWACWLDVMGESNTWNCSLPLGEGNLQSKLNGVLLTF